MVNSMRIQDLIELSDEEFEKIMEAERLETENHFKELELLMTKNGINI